MADLSILVFSELEECARAFRAALETSGHARVVDVVDDPASLADAVRTLDPDCVFADLGHAPHEVLDVIDAIPAPRPDLVVCGSQDDSQVILRALKQGAREFLPPNPDEHEFTRAIERLSLTPDPHPRRLREAPILAVLGAKGGVGTTVVASQLALSLQRVAGPTAIVDLNYPLGDVALQLDVRPQYTLADVPDAELLDAAVLRSLLQEHPSGVSILAAPSRIEDAELVRDTHVEAVLRILRREMSLIVVDVSRSCNEASMRALDLADHILVVTVQDVPTLNHTRALDDLLRRLGHQSNRIHTVVNRHSRQAPVSDADVLDFLGSEPAARLPNDYATTVSSVNEGRPVSEVAAGSPLDRAFAELAHQVCAWSGLETEQAPRPTRGLGSRLRNLLQKG